jgi:hypothetical protein
MVYDVVSHVQISTHGIQIEALGTMTASDIFTLGSYLWKTLVPVHDCSVSSLGQRPHSV